MNLTQMDSAFSVFEALAGTAQARLLQITEEEAKIRSLLADLDSQEKGDGGHFYRDTALRRLGGDTAWHRWIGQNREKLNLHLAKVLYQKEIQTAEFRQAVGRKNVLAKLRDEQKLTARQKRIQKELWQINALALLESKSD